MIEIIIFVSCVVAIFYYWYLRKASHLKVDGKLKESIEKDDMDFRTHTEKMLSLNIELSENLVDVWHELIVNSPYNWVIFKHGTMVVVEENDDIEEVAKVKLKESINYRDFSTDLVDDYPVCLVRTTYKDVINFVELGKEVVSKEISNPVSVIGMLALSIRQQDSEDEIIVHVEKV